MYTLNEAPFSKYWPEDGFVKTEICSQNYVLFIIYWCCVKSELTTLLNITTLRYLVELLLEAIWYIWQDDTRSDLPFW